LFLISCIGGVVAREEKGPSRASSSSLSKREGGKGKDCSAPRTFSTNGEKGEKREGRKSRLVERAKRGQKKKRRLGPRLKEKRGGGFLSWQKERREGRSSRLCLQSLGEKKKRGRPHFSPGGEKGTIRHSRTRLKELGGGEKLPSSSHPIAEGLRKPEFKLVMATKKKGIRGGKKKKRI